MKKEDEYIKDLEWLVEHDGIGGCYSDYKGMLTPEEYSRLYYLGKDIKINAGS